ncbi:probable potassium transporter 17 isoform X1 [Tanacetum coccineum]
MLAEAWLIETEKHLACMPGTGIAPEQLVVGLGRYDWAGIPGHCQKTNGGGSKKRKSKTAATEGSKQATRSKLIMTVGPTDDDHLVTVDDSSSTTTATATATVTAATTCNQQQGNSSLSLAYKSLGVVFGGLVTSPLYVYPSMALKSPTTDDYLGIYSIMFWTLTLIGVVKYACIALKADDQGEGGTFALYSLLCRHMNIGAITSRNVNSQSSLSHNNMHQGFKKPSRLGMFMERSLIARRVLFFIAILGMCMLIGDGILTPAISVLSAMDGIRGPFPDFSKCKLKSCPGGVGSESLLQAQGWLCGGLGGSEGGKRKGEDKRDDEEKGKGNKGRKKKERGEERKDKRGEDAQNQLSNDRSSRGFLIAQRLRAGASVYSRRCGGLLVCGLGLYSALVLWVYWAMGLYAGGLPASQAFSCMVFSGGWRGCPGGGVEDGHNMAVVVTRCEEVTGGLMCGGCDEGGEMR